MLCLESRLGMIAENKEGVICISLNRDSVLSGKSGKDTTDVSRAEFN